MRLALAETEALPMDPRVERLDLDEERANSGRLVEEVEGDEGLGGERCRLR